MQIETEEVQNFTQPKDQPVAMKSAPPMEVKAVPMMDNQPINVKAQPPSKDVG